MTLYDKRVLLAEWMGWAKCSHPKCAGLHDENGNVHSEPPCLTLDWLHECEKKLVSEDYQLANKYAGILHDILEDEVTERELAQDPNSIPDVYGFEWIHANAEQRLDALLKTIGKL